MGFDSSQTLIPSLLALSLFSSLTAGAAVRAPKATLETVRNEINNIERDLLQTKETQISAANQLKKIRKLSQLQQKEIELSKARIDEFTASLQELSTQKQTLLDDIEKRKASLRLRLRELSKLTETEALDARWLAGVDAETQKTYFLEKTLKKDLASVDRLKKDVEGALGLELRILEEKNKLDYYVHELQSQMSLLSANEAVQTEILRTNRASRLEALERMRSLKESERELQTMLSAVMKPEAPVSGGVEAGFVTLKGKLPLPAEGRLLSGFGKSYNAKTNLLTFQKGITLMVRPEAEVRAVASGKVVFSGPLKNYGLIAIVEHTGQYYTLYGQMGSVSVEEGKLVKQGQVLGKTAGEPLYFEIRNKNVAVNPLPWVMNGSITLSKQ